jgi:hypothetical protein
MRTGTKQRTVLSRTGMLCILLAIAAITGCARRHDDRAGGRTRAMSETETNRQIIRSHFDEQAHAGILVSLTLFPHHFHKNLASLNLLGERQIQILAANADRRPLRLHVAAGDVDEELYEARLAAVRERLALAGIEHVAFLDAPPAATAISSDRAIRALQREQQVMTAERDVRPGTSAGR